MGTPFIIVDKVSKKFGDKEVLTNISLQINEGERMGIIGRSGSGKTALLSMLRGMVDYAPTKGRVIYRIAYCKKCEHVEAPSLAGAKCPKCSGKLKLEEVDFWKMGEAAQALKNRIAMMFQRTFALYGSLTVYENIVEALNKTSICEENVGKRALEIGKEMGLSHRLLHTARDLSGGEKQRVVLGRQLALNPILLLADEPTGTLDQISASAIYKILTQETKSHDTTLLITSHMPDAIKQMTDQAVLLEDGRIEALGATADVVTKFLSKVKPEEISKPEVLGEVMLKVKDVKKYYFSIDRGVVKALDGISFDVKERQIFGIIGLSGAGKTTISRIISGVSTPTSGSVELRIGDDWVNMSEPGVLGRGRATPYIGLLHQEYTLYPHLNVIENLTDAVGLGLPDEFARFKANVVLTATGFKESGINKLLLSLPDELSEGERHRVALAQVLIREPHIILLDEPSGTMDPFTKQEVSKSIKNARNELGQTFIIVSHDLEFVLDTCEEVILMREGKVVGRGMPSDVLKIFTTEEEREMAQPDLKPSNST
jgi:methyl coenzyme M reductase system subunit A2